MPFASGLLDFELSIGQIDCCRMMTSGMEHDRFEQAATSGAILAIFAAVFGLLWLSGAGQ